MVLGTHGKARRSGRSASRAAGRLRLVAVSLGLLGLCLPAALATPRRSDETALLVCASWVLLWLWPRPRADQRWRSGAGRSSVGRFAPERSPVGCPATERQTRRPSRRRRRAWPGWVARALAGLAGLAVYGLSFSLAPRAGLATGEGLSTAGRPRVVVTTAEAPVFVGRVVVVNPDLSLVVDDGLGPGPLPSEVTGAWRQGETIGLAGVNAFEAPQDRVERAARRLRSEVLGRLVTVRVTGPPGPAPGSAGAGIGLPAQGSPKMLIPRVVGFVWSGVAGQGGLTTEESVNEAVLRILEPPGPADGEAPAKESPASAARDRGEP